MPYNLEYLPPLMIRCFDHRHPWLGGETFVGAKAISNPKAYFYDPELEKKSVLLFDNANNNIKQHRIYKPIKLVSKNTSKNNLSEGFYQNASMT